MSDINTMIKAHVRMSVLQNRIHAVDTHPDLSDEDKEAIINNLTRRFDYAMGVADEKSDSMQYGEWQKQHEQE